MKCPALWLIYQGGQAQNCSAASPRAAPGTAPRCGCRHPAGALLLLPPALEEPGRRLLASRRQRAEACSDTPPLPAGGRARSRADKSSASLPAPRAGRRAGHSHPSPLPFGSGACCRWGFAQAARARGAAWCPQQKQRGAREGKKREDTIPGFPKSPWVIVAGGSGRCLPG